MLEKILEKIQKKGWELYEMGAEATARCGPITSLAPGKSFFFLPQDYGPRGVLQMYVALCYGRGEEAAPQIQYRGKRLFIPSVRMERQYIVPAHFKIRITYKDFCQSLDSLNFAPCPN